jgi:type II restriction enzyme
MDKKHQLRELRTGTVINTTSKTQEKDINRALKKVVENLRAFSPIALVHEKRWKLEAMCAHLRKHFPEVDFHYHFDSSDIRPDGGILRLVANDDERFPILVAEVKNQGTNDLRAKEGLPKQSKGNAIERLGKNVIGLRAALRNEAIFPFVCFGYGCDFRNDSSIRDRVTMMAMFGHLNKTYLHALGPNGIFDRGSFYFREDRWTVDEMTEIMTDIAKRSVQYYFSRYGEKRFLPER